MIFRRFRPLFAAGLGLAAALSFSSAAQAAFSLATGKYTGDGTGFRTIAVGFAPDVVLIKGSNNKPTYCATSTMVAGTSKRLDLPYPLFANRILNLGLDGFTVSSDVDVNQSGDEYYWTAFKDAGSLAIGSYVGNKVDNRNITSVGFQPDYVIVFSESNTMPYQRSSAMPSDRSGSFYSGSLMTDRVQEMTVDGFQIGTNDEVNKLGATFQYIAWKAAAGQMSVGTYTGNGLDNRTIAGVGFQPGYVISKAYHWSSQDAVHRPASLEGDTTLYFRNLANYANGIQALQTDGFQIGTHASVNGNGLLYYWTAFASTTGGGSLNVKVLKWLETP